MTFWAEQIFHLVLNLVFVLAFYFSVFKLPAMLRAPLKGDPKQIEGEFVRVWYGLSKDNGIGEIQIEFRVPEGVKFSLRIETWFDRLAKRLGLIRERQFEQNNFDELMFLQLPGSLVAMAHSQPKSLHWISGLHTRLQSMGVRLRQLHADAGRLKLELSIYPPKRDVRQVEEMCVQWLKSPLQALRSLPTAKHESSYWPVLQRHLSTLFLLVSASFLVWFHFGNEHLLSLGPISCYALIPAAVLVLLWHRWLERQFDLSAVRHRVIVLLLLAGAPLLWAQSAFCLRQLNIAFDFRAPNVVPLEFAQLHRSSRRKAQDLFEIYYRTREDQVSDSLLISPSRYQKLARDWPEGESRSAVLLEHPGALGIAWVEIISPLR